MSTPYYSQIADRIKEEIRNRSYKPGDVIPSIRNLSRKYSVGKSTVERAIYRLIDQGVLYSERGRGLFVADTATGTTSSRTGIIGILTSMGSTTYTQGGFATDVLNGLQGALSRTGRDILIVSDSGLARERHLRPMRHHLVDGYIAFGPINEIFLGVVKTVPKPLVFVDHDGSALGYDSVVVDNYGGLLVAMEYLFERGHRDIAFLGGLLLEELLSTEELMIDFAARERFEGYRIAMQARSLPVPENRVWRVENRVTEYSRQSALKGLSQPDRPTAIMCFGGESAIGAYEACQELGLRVPEDISIAAFGDTEKIGEIPLTRVNFNAREMGAVGGQVLLDRLSRGRDGFLRHVVPIEFISGESTGPV